MALTDRSVCSQNIERSSTLFDGVLLGKGNDNPEGLRACMDSVLLTAEVRKDVTHILTDSCVLSSTKFTVAEK